METAMSVLLRHPALVPSLFARAAEPDPQPRRGPAWLRLARAAPSRTAAVWAAMAVIEVPLVKVGLEPFRLLLKQGLDMGP